ncbi:glutamate-5-semialdehyde dehydrogenase [Portibacter marinus]|uniref:glutamate-5-semialdehyde dehydrogenase n=1 Tax=Portibacter marinus TaxID=2898660 RepID=UPI001F3CBA50|nr:glutamate-5-semialdehyde dehydrogenase [Portibacter marinus]
MKQINTEIKDNVLRSMIRLLDENRSMILKANKKDVNHFDRDDQALLDRLIVDNTKIDDMKRSLREVLAQEDPVKKVISEITTDNGLKVINRTAAFGTIMIIYESRPDVTIEAAVLAFKAGNKIFLKGGKEAKFSNKALVELWHKALSENNLSNNWIEYLELSRQETRDFLVSPTEKLDLIVPRGGEKLIQFVKENAKCAVLVSGRGNNFMYVHTDADWETTKKVIINAKTHKISACNALDKILINRSIAALGQKLNELQSLLQENDVQVLVDQEAHEYMTNSVLIEDQEIWSEEFLAMKCCVGLIDNATEAIDKINRHSGGHSSTIMTEDEETAMHFMDQVDNAAVYHNASTRFTDGGQMGVGAELAISTDKLHHRGPLGLKELVTNKYYVFGNGQIRT